MVIFSNWTKVYLYCWVRVCLHCSQVRILAIICFLQANIYFFFSLFLIGRILLYSAVLVSVIQQHESIIIIYIPSLLNLPPVPTAHFSRLSQSARLGSRCYIANSLIVVNMSMLLSQFVALSTCTTVSTSHSLLSWSVPFF